MMSTNEFAQTLWGCIKTVLLWLGVPSRLLDEWNELIFLLLIVALAFALGSLFHCLTVRFLRRFLRFKDIPFLHSLMDNKVMRKVSAVIPPLILSALLPFAFDARSDWYTSFEKLTWIYFFFTLAMAINAVLHSVGCVLMNREQWQNRPMKGFIQIFQVLCSCLAFILMISILMDKSPLNLITGLGAFAAVLMLVFKDTILGFVAGVLLSSNDMVRLGDWIEMPQNGVNGVVVDISLNIVKVQNFDNTIVTLPPYALVSGAFVNWRGMSESGGRRIMREYVLKLDYIQPCTPEFLERMKAFDADLAAFITAKQRQQAEGKTVNTDNPEGLVNGTIDTNVGLLRAYLTLYLRRHPAISNELLLMVRTLAPTPNGLPLQIYCFSANKDWVAYESIQAEILEHFVSVLPVFGLYPFQNPGARDYLLSGWMESNRDLDDLVGIPWYTLRDDRQESVLNQS